MQLRNAKPYFQLCFDTTDSRGERFVLLSCSHAKGSSYCSFAPYAARPQLSDTKLADPNSGRRICEQSVGVIFQWCFANLGMAPFARTLVLAGVDHVLEEASLMNFGLLPCNRGVSFLTRAR